jgi:UDP-N-acetylglucosamine diphosphorylase / glucose-1-phosphate thymidylyltransferase / UDP-N-acetylgalactosamine diphosphorylase / glucosamine-1-phosphate N-acetyltransferase / galactosamine-1-phosphate N-acetyltransferase
MHVVAFEDDRVSRLHPITLGRPAYAITCATYRLADWLPRLGDSVTGLVRPHLREIQRIDFPRFGSAGESAGEPTLLVNARTAPTVAALKALQSIVKTNRPGIVRSGENVAAALLPPNVAVPTEATVSDIKDFLGSPAVATLPDLDASLPLFDYPHDVVRLHMQSFGESIALRLAEGDYREAADGVFAAEGASLGEFVVSNSRNGPIVIDQGAVVGPHAYLAGPVYIGPHARINEHAAIKDAVSLGHTTKIGGEVEASIIEPYTNKQHHGFLGHSYLGSWINLGAGTCNSDLKNTYGEVNMVYQGEKVATGMQFFGCVMGDYAKTAINTGIFTGKTIGSCSMLYGFVTTNVPSYVNYARLFGQLTELPPDVMIATQRRMFARRKVEQRPCDVQLLWDMFELTRHERQLASEPMSL